MLRTDIRNAGGALIATGRNPGCFTIRGTVSRCFLVKVMGREANRTLPYVATQPTLGLLATGPAGCCSAKGC